MCGIWRADAGREMTTQEWKKVFKELRAEGLLYLGFQGGEPLMRPDLLELVSFARSLGLEVAVVTNGVLLNEKLAEQLLSAGVKWLEVSVDALGKDFDRIRGVPGAFERVADACRILSGLQKKYDFRLFITATIMQPVLPHVFKLVDWAEGLHIPVIFNLLHFAPFFLRAAEEEDGLRIEGQGLQQLDEVIDALIRLKTKKPWFIPQGYLSLKFIKDYFHGGPKKYPLCRRAYARIFLDSRGKVYGGCPWAMGELADARVASMHEIIRSKKYIAAHRKMFFKECMGCSGGYHMEFYLSFSYILEELCLRLFYRYVRFREQ
jgi:MoaA/NifB/PqqE/SkfB family radical SAM enzyme